MAAVTLSPHLPPISKLNSVIPLRAAEKIPLPLLEHGSESGGEAAKPRMVEAGASFMDKVEAAADEDGGGGDGARAGGGDKGGEEAEIEEMEPVEPLPEPPDDGGPIAWPMPDFCPLTIDGTVKESFLETIRKDAAEGDRPPREEDAEAEGVVVVSPDSRPSSSKRHRAGTASPSSRSSPCRNILQVFQQCRQDVVGETPTKNY